MTSANLPLPGGYAELLEDLKQAVTEARWRAQRVVNTELIALYWCWRTRLVRTAATSSMAT